MLARAINTSKWLFVQQTFHSVFLCHSLQRDHDELLMVGRNVGVFIDRCDFVLRRRHFVVPGLDRNAQLVELSFCLKHASQNSFRNCAEVMILKLLALWGLGTKQGSPRVQQIRSRKEEVAVYQKVLLLSARSCRDSSRVWMAEELENALSLLVESLH